jgi:hypothetical protein
LQKALKDWRSQRKIIYRGLDELEGSLDVRAKLRGRQQQTSAVAAKGKRHAHTSEVIYE